MCCAPREPRKIFALDPGAGVYCNVHVVSTEKIHVGVWGTYVTTPRVGEDFASVKIEANIENSAGEEIEVSTEIVAPDGP